MSVTDNFPTEHSEIIRKIKEGAIRMLSERCLTW